MSNEINPKAIQEALNHFVEDGQSIEDVYRSVLSFLRTAQNAHMIKHQTYEDYLATCKNKPELLERLIRQVQTAAEQTPQTRPRHSP